MDCRKLPERSWIRWAEKKHTSVTHCFTRLRLVLRDRKLADKEKVSRLEGVISVVDGGGQFQVVIGNRWSRYMTRWRSWWMWRVLCPAEKKRVPPTRCFR